MKYPKNSKESSESKNFEKGERLMKTEREYREPSRGKSKSDSMPSGGRKNYKGKNWC
jgi:hypothetical protein